MPRIAELEQAALGKILEERIRQQACEYSLLVEDVWKSYSHRPAAFRGLIKYELDKLISNEVVAEIEVHIPRRKIRLHLVYEPVKEQEKFIADLLASRFKPYLLKEFRWYNPHLPESITNQVCKLTLKKNRTI